MNCKICGKDLFVELDYRTLFKLNYTIHESCKKYLYYDVTHEVVPIENNTIILLYFFENYVDLNLSNMEFYLVGKGLNYCLSNEDWSIVMWCGMNEYLELDSLVQYFILMLSDQSLVLLSIFRDM